MLDRLASFLNRSKTPFSSLKAAQQWWKSLNECDPGTQLQKTQEAVSAHFSSKQSFSIDELHVLLWLDAAVQPAFEAICFQYVSNPRMPAETERKLWSEVGSFCQCMTQAYENFIRTDADDRLAAGESDMPQVLACALRYVAIQTKWHYFRFEKVPTRLWKMASRYYRLAEIGGFDSNPFHLYPNFSEQVTSCTDEYLQMLMLATLSNNNLSVAQINLVDYWLVRWSKLLHLERSWQKHSHHYCVSLLEPAGPQKITPDAAEENHRFWAIDELVGKVRRKIAQLDGGETPKSLGLGNHCTTAMALELLKHLDSFWTMSMRNSQIARNPRVKVDKVISVMRGLDNICAHVRTDNDRYLKGSGQAKKVDYDEVIDMRLYGFVSDRTRNKQSLDSFSLSNKAPDSSVWSVDNESIGGMGAILDFRSNDWARPGALVAVKPSDKDNWQVAVLRRLNRLSEEKVYAGLQILAAAPVSVSMHVEGEDRLGGIAISDLSYSGSYELPGLRQAIYLPHKIDNTLVNTLIMRPADYKAMQIYQVRSREKVFSVRLGSIVEKGNDWIWVVVNVLRHG